MEKELILAAVLAAALAVPASAQLVEQVDLKKAERPVPGADSAMIVLRPHATKMAGDNRILFYRYDAGAGRVVTEPDGKPAGVRINYSYSLFGGRKGEKALRVAIVPAGDYVFAGRTFNGNYTDIFCLGAPRFTLAPGAVAYLGDYEMLSLEKMADGERRNAMRYATDLAGARADLATAYPALAPQLAGWTPTNGTTFACAGDEFTAFAVPGPAAAAGP